LGARKGRPYSRKDKLNISQTVVAFPPGCIYNVEKGTNFRAEGEWVMAVILSMGDLGIKQPQADNKKSMKKWFENPFYDAEMHRVNMSRAVHPSQANENVIDLLYIWAAVYTGFSMHWFVKYVI